MSGLTYRTCAFQTQIVQYNPTNRFGSIDGPSHFYKNTEYNHLCFTLFAILNFPQINYVPCWKTLSHSISVIYTEFTLG